MMTLVPTIPDALYIGATAVDRVYQGPEQVWPEPGNGPLFDHLMSYNPVHLWPMDEASGDLTDYGSDPVPLVPADSPKYQQTMGHVVGVEVGLASFGMSWSFPPTPTALVMFTQTVNPDRPSLLGDTASWTTLNVRGAAPYTSSTWHGKPAAYVGDSSGITTTSGAGTGVTLTVVRFEATTVSVRCVNDDGSYGGTAFPRVLPAHTSQGQLNTEGDKEPGLVSYLAWLGSLPADGFQDDIWAAYQAEA